MPEGGPQGSALSSCWSTEMRQELRALDHAVFDAIADTSTPQLDRWVVAVSESANYSRLWFVIAAGLATSHGRRGRRAALQGILAVGMASAVTNLAIKPAVNRRRPVPSQGTDVPASRSVRRPVSTSFPSGHTASAFAFAGAAGRLVPSAALPLHATATLVGYSRVHTGMHYPSDVAVGALVGALCGWTVHRLAGGSRTGLGAEGRAR